MQETDKNKVPQKIHQRAYHHVKHHVKKHKKNYVRVLLFFVFLIIYSVIEDAIAMALHGVEFDLAVLVNVFIIAIVFTGIAQLTEKLYNEEKDEIEEYERKVGKAIRKEEDFLGNEERMIERKIKKK